MKIASWNVCLGILNKKDIIEQVIKDNNIDICCIQEIEIPSDFPINNLTFKEYAIETEQNEYKIRGSSKQVLS